MNFLQKMVAALIVCLIATVIVFLPVSITHSVWPAVLLPFLTSIRVMIVTLALLIVVYCGGTMLTIVYLFR